MQKKINLFFTFTVPKFYRRLNGRKKKIGEKRKRKTLKSNKKEKCAVRDDLVVFKQRICVKVIYGLFEYTLASLWQKIV